MGFQRTYRMRAKYFKLLAEFIWCCMENEKTELILLQHFDNSASFFFCHLILIWYSPLWWVFLSVSLIANLQLPPEWTDQFESGIQVDFCHSQWFFFSWSKSSYFAHLFVWIRLLLLFKLAMASFNLVPARLLVCFPSFPLTTMISTDC